MSTSIYHFEGNPTHLSTRLGVEGCCDVLSFLSDRSSRQCFNLFGLDPKTMKLSFLSVMESIEQEVKYIGRLIDSLRFTPECLAERTKNLLTLQQLCEELVIEVLNSILSKLEQPSFYLDGKPVMFDDVTTLFHESNAAQRFFLFGAELNCKASDILGVLSAIQEVRVSSGATRNLDVLETVYTRAKNQLAGANMGDDDSAPTISSGKRTNNVINGEGNTWSNACKMIVQVAPAVLKSAVDIVTGLLF